MVLFQLDNVSYWYHATIQQYRVTDAITSTDDTFASLFSRDSKTFNVHNIVNSQYPSKRIIQAHNILIGITFAASWIETVKYIS